MVILADTNIWIGHFRYGDERLVGLLTHNLLACHPIIIGELATGNLKAPRAQTIEDFGLLPVVRPASFDETLHLLEERTLYGKGLQWNDISILAAVVAAGDTLLWTNDRRLDEAATECGVAYCGE